MNGINTINHASMVKLCVHKKFNKKATIIVIIISINTVAYFPLYVSIIIWTIENTI
jgi:hypothetical protein